MVLAVCLSVFAAAFAQELPAGDAFERQDIPQELKDKRDILKELYETGSLMREELQTARQNKQNLFKQLREKFKERKAEDLEKLKGLHEKFINDMNAFRNRLKELNTELRQAIDEKNKDKINEIREAIKELKETIEEKKSEYAEIREKINEEKEFLKSLRDQFLSLKEELEPYKVQAAAIIEELKSQTEQMIQYRSELKAAMEAQDYTKASEILDNMIKLKTEKNTNLQKLIDIKNTVAEIIKEKEAA